MSPQKKRKPKRRNSRRSPTQATSGSPSEPPPEVEAAGPDSGEDGDEAPHPAEPEPEVATTSTAASDSTIGEAARSASADEGTPPAVAPVPAPVPPPVPPAEAATASTPERAPGPPSAAEATRAAPAPTSARLVISEHTLEPDRYSRWAASVARTARGLLDRAKQFFEPRRTLPIAMDPSARLAPASRVRPTGSAQTGRPILRGHAAALSVPDILGVLSGLRKSGVFGIWTEEESYRIWLVDGTVVWAQSHTPNRWLLLGQILVAQDAIAQTLLAQFLEQRPDSHARLGEALLEAGLIDREQLERAIAYQAQRIFDRAYAMQDASYSFEPLATPKGDEHGLSVTYLLLESARGVDEAEHRREAV